MLCAKQSKEQGIKMSTAKSNKNENIRARHQKSGGIYLTIVGKSEESYVALKYAGQMAKANNCQVGALRILEDQDFQHWGGIEERIRAEQHEEAEAMLADISKTLKTFCGLEALTYIEEGSRLKTLEKFINENPDITMLVLTGGTSGNGPGPLVSHFTSKGLERLHVPVLVVPDHLDMS